MRMNSKKLTRRAFLAGAALAATGAGLAGAHLFRRVKHAARSKPTLYLVATAHNDTQWNWTVQNTIRDYIPNTMRPNWKLFEAYPEYCFNYEGVIHYMFFKEYHPEDWAELQSWVRRGRWKLSGSWINACDVNIPSAESLFRQALYGQQFFRREFGQVSRDVYLPDCFGFPYSLPSIARHSGLIAFSTQKLTWGCWVKPPFSIGRWQGADGSEVVAALRCGAYGMKVPLGVATDPTWIQDFSEAQDRRVDLRYFGTGDIGGTPGQWSVAHAQAGAQDKDAPVRIVIASADQLAKDLTPSEVAALPKYDGELILAEVGTGGYTSQAARKKWNRMNEQMADAAERACLAAAWLGGPAYPHETLNHAWVRVLWHQFHDDLPGTCIPQAYTFSWNDDLLSLTQFSQALTTGVGAVAQHLDTQTQGIPLVVYNALDQARDDVVETTVMLPHAASEVRVFDPATGREVLSQTLGRNGSAIALLFHASVPSIGFKVYDVRASHVPCPLTSSLQAAQSSLKNDRCQVHVNRSGDIASIFDKQIKTEMLRAPSQLQQFHDVSQNWPAWDILWKTVSEPPRGTVGENPRITIIEQGPVRVSLEVTRTLGASTFVQQIRLTHGGDWVEVQNDVDWRTPGTLIKASFPMTVSNPNATYDLGLGTIERPNADEARYEVPAHQWADVTDRGGVYGLAILTKDKYGWDKPSNNTLRLSLIRTPDSGGSWPHQQTNDIGHHHFAYALASHGGDWRSGNVPKRAARFNQPLRAFQTARHPGPGGHSFSFLQISTDQVAVRALKKSEENDEWVIRVQELHGMPAHRVVVKFAAPILAVREINAAEEAVGPYEAQDGLLVFDLTPYQPRTFALSVADATAKIVPPASVPLALPYDLDGVSLHGDLNDGAFDASGQTYPGELWPARLAADGIDFVLGSSAPGIRNILTCQGQTINLPSGRHNRLYFLAASIEGDRSGEFRVDASDGSSQSTPLTIQDWAQHIGQWDSRLAHPSIGDGGPQVVHAVEDGKVVDIEKMHPAYIKRANIAWVGTHRHGLDGDQTYLFCYLFKYRLDLPSGAVSVTLPHDSRIRIMAMTAAWNLLDETYPAGVLFEPELTKATIPRPPVAQSGTTGKIVFHLAEAVAFDSARTGMTKFGVAGLPLAPNASWTINLFVFLDKLPEDRILFGGFGDVLDESVKPRFDGTQDIWAPMGKQRYLGASQSGIFFSGGGFTVETGTPCDIGTWQMLTATYDGVRVCVYKDGVRIGEGDAFFGAAAPTVKLADQDTVPARLRVSGTVRDVTVWSAALPPDAIRALARPL